MEQAPLSAAYERCRALHRHHGRTYYLATKLLPAWKRRHVHALYGFTRYADEIVDRSGDLTPQQRAVELDTWSAQFVAGLAGAPTDDPLLPAVLHTIQVFNIDLEDFRKFLASMAMDLTVTEYATYADLLEYMEGSAAVIGTMMLPILESADRAAALQPARQLGLAFQLTNFIRDVAEDLDRGRIYLPLEDLRRFGVTPADLREAARIRRSSDKIKSLMVYEVQRARSHYIAAAPGIPMLAPSSQACMRAAFRIYGGILDEIEAQDHDVFVRRATVPKLRRLGVAVRCLLTRPGNPVPIPGTASELLQVPIERSAGLPAHEAIDWPVNVASDPSGGELVGSVVGAKVGQMLGHMVGQMAGSSLSEPGAADALPVQRQPIVERAVPAVLDLRGSAA